MYYIMVTDFPKINLRTIFGMVVYFAENYPSYVFYIVIYMCVYNHINAYSP